MIIFIQIKIWIILVTVIATGVIGMLGVVGLSGALMFS